jgi:hypothetical protein
MSPNQKLPFEIPSKAPEKWSRGEVIPFVKSGMVVELSTIPLYLYALYSIKPESEPGIQPGIQARTALRGSVDLSKSSHINTDIYRRRCSAGNAASCLDRQSSECS